MKQSQHLHTRNNSNSRRSPFASSFSPPSPNFVARGAAGSGGGGSGAGGGNAVNMTDTSLQQQQQQQHQHHDHDIDFVSDAPFRAMTPEHDQQLAKGGGGELIPESSASLASTQFTPVSARTAIWEQNQIYADFRPSVNDVDYSHIINHHHQQQQLQQQRQQQIQQQQQQQQLEQQQQQQTHDKGDEEEQVESTQDDPRLSLVGTDSHTSPVATAPEKHWSLFVFFICSFLFMVVAVVVPIVLFLLLVFTTVGFDSADLVLFVCWTLYSFCVGGVHFVLLRRMHRQPIRARSPFLLIVSSVSGYIIATWICLSMFFKETKDMNCHALSFLVNLAYPGFVLPYFFRAYRLWYCFNLNQETMDGGTKFSSATAQRTQRALLRWLFLALSPFVIVSILGLFLTPSSSFIIFPLGSTPSCGPPALQIGILWTAVHALEVMAFVFVVVLLRKVWDIYNIREELAICGAATAAYSVIIILFQTMKIGHNSALEISFLVVSRIVLFFSLSVLWPVYRSFFRTATVQSFPHKEILGSLEDILHEPVAFQYFRQFIVQELNADLLKFWTEVELYREIEDPAELFSTSERIIDTYIISRRIMLSSDAMRRLATTRRNNSIMNGGQSGIASTDMFDEAQRDVFHTMESISYPRFLRSDLCRQLVAEIEKQEHVVGRLVSSQVI